MTKRDSLRLRAEKLDAQTRARWQALLAQEGDDLDDDGYPTQLALDKIAAWHWSDSQGWLTFVESLWHLPTWGWSEADVPHEWAENRTVHRYSVSTAGWSGNEDVIQAMQKNCMLWQEVWAQSRRGGHYIFERETEERADADEKIPLG